MMEMARDRIGALKMTPTDNQSSMNDINWVEERLVVYVTS